MTLLLVAAVTAAEAVRDRYETDLTHAPAVRARVQALDAAGYTEASDVQVTYLQTFDCTPACTHRYLVTQAYFATTPRTPISRPLVAVYDLVVTPGQVREYYPRLVRVQDAER